MQLPPTPRGTGRGGGAWPGGRETGVGGWGGGVLEPCRPACGREASPCSLLPRPAQQAAPADSAPFAQLWGAHTGREEFKASLCHSASRPPDDTVNYPLAPWISECALSTLAPCESPCPRPPTVPAGRVLESVLGGSRWVIRSIAEGLSPRSKQGEESSKRQL